MGVDEMISYGGGVNSTAMTILLVEQGWRGPVVFADVGDDSQPCEHPETLCYLNYFEREYLQPRGLELTRLRPGDEWHRVKGKRDVGLYTYCFERRVVPFMSVRWCSIEWKLKPTVHYQQANGIARRHIGMSCEESGRLRDDDLLSYPLAERGITREECGRIITRAGLEVPPKSSCFFCPNQADKQWHRLLIDHPDLYELAANLERRATARTGGHVTLDIDDISLDEKRTRRAWDGQLEMDLPGMARPCICGL